MNVLITGSGGQLGWELCRTVPAEIKCRAFSSAELDITDAVKVRNLVVEVRPDVIINAAAYTAVDKAEEDAERAFAVNRDGAANLALAAKEAGTAIIHVSTDFVFDGQKSSPYLPDDKPNPTGIYGESKLLGEERILAINGTDKTAIIRTAWVYSSHGNNFVKTMLRLMAERDELGVVADQVGTPTWANGLAKAIWQMAGQKIFGVFHWTDAGVASWYDFAMAIMEEGVACGLLKKPINIKPLRTEEYPTPACRPPYSVLDKSTLWQALGETAPHWRSALRQMLKDCGG